MVINGIPVTLTRTETGVLIEAKGKVACIQHDLLFDTQSDEHIEKSLREACMFGGYATYERYLDANSSMRNLPEEHIKVQYALERAVYLSLVDMFGFDVIESSSNPKKGNPIHGLIGLEQIV